MPNLSLPQRALYTFSMFLTAAYLCPVHAFPYRTFFSEMLPLVGVGLALFILAWSRAVPVRLPRELALPIGLAVVIAAQVWSGLLLYPIDAVFPILELIGCAMAIVLGATLVRSENGLREVGVTLAWTFVVSGLLSVFCQHIQVFRLNWAPWIYPLVEGGVNRPFANLGQPNLLALLLCIALISTWLLYSAQQVKSGVAVTLAVVLLWGVALTQSRASWMILALYSMLCWNPPSDVRSVSKKALLVWFGLFVAMVMLTPIFLSCFGFAADSLTHRVEQNAIRLNLLNQAWHFSFLHPWFGSGWGQFGILQADFAQQFPPGEYSNHCHNIFLNLAVEAGWPCTLLAVAASAVWLYRSVFRRWRNVQVRFLALILIAMLAHSLVEYPLWFGFYLIPLALIVGALHIDATGDTELLVSRKILAAVGGVLVVVLAVVSLDVARISKASDVADQPQGVHSLAENFPKPWYSVSGQYYDYLYLRELRIAPDAAQANIPVFAKLSRRFAYTPVLESLALLYVMDKQPDLALQTLIKLERLHDLNTPVYRKIYIDWENLARSDPPDFAPVFRRMPMPIASSNTGAPQK